jgi:hypothetical protein
MFSDSVETLKTQYTDKYVKVDASRPELARFRDVVGQVKTVNMNGRALVEFLDYHLNIGWFDIDLNSLTVVEPPSKDVTAKPEPKRAHDKPEGKAAPTSGAKQVADAKALAGGEKKLSPLELARMQGASGKGAAAPAKAEGAKPAGGKASTADILAAARGGAGAAKPAAGKPSTADILAAARGKAPVAPTAAEAKSEAKPAAVAPAKPAGGKLSTADILAAARGNGGSPAAEPSPSEAEAPAVAPPTAEAVSPAASAAPAPSSSGGVVRVDKSGMTVEQMIAYCREHDGK